MIWGDWLSQIKVSRAAVIYSDIIFCHIIFCHIIALRANCQLWRTVLSADSVNSPKKAHSTQLHLLACYYT